MGLEWFAAVRNEERFRAVGVLRSVHEKGLGAKPRFNAPCADMNNVETERVFKRSSGAGERGVKSSYSARWLRRWNQLKVKACATEGALLNTRTGERRKET